MTSAVEAPWFSLRVRQWSLFRRYCLVRIWNIAVVGAIAVGVMSNSAQANMNRTKLPAATQVSSQASLSFGSDIFVRSDQVAYSPGASPQLPFLNAKFENFKKPEDPGFSYNIRGQWSIAEEHLYTHVPNLSWSWNWGESQLTLGRKTVTWSEADDFWRLGFWQGRAFEDKLIRPTEGLVGLFWHSSQHAPLQLTLLASPAYIPDLSSKLEIVDHKFYSKSPWFNVPMPKVYLENVETNIHYSLAPYEISDVVNNPGVALGLSYKWDQIHRLKWSWAYKPIQQLMFAFPYTWYLGPNESEVRIEINGRVFYQRISSLEYVFDNPTTHWKGWLSLTHETPIYGSMPEKWITQELAPSTTVSIYMKAPLSFAGFTEDSHIYLAGVKINGGEAPDKGLGSLQIDSGDASDPGVTSNPNQSLFERRFIYTEAISLGFRNERSLRRGRSLVTDLHGTYDFLQMGTEFSAQAELRWNKQWQFFARMDWLGPVASPDSSAQTGFFSYYRANDRLQIGGTYVF